MKCSRNSETENPALEELIQKLLGCSFKQACAEAAEESGTDLAVTLLQDQVSPLCERAPGAAPSRRLRLHLGPVPVAALCGQEGAAGLCAEGCMGCCCHLRFPSSLPPGAARDSLAGYCPLWGQGQAAVTACFTSIPFKERGSG